MNSYTTIGRLTRDTETKYIPTATSQTCLTTFSLAVDVGFGTKKKTIFWDCKIWGERGETFAKYVLKGHQVGLEASIDQDEWDDKATGEKRKKLLLNVNNFTLLANGERGQQTQTQPARTTRNIPRAQPQAQETEMEGGDIPW